MKNLIFESPDRGNTIYVRTFGSKDSFLYKKNYIKKEVINFNGFQLEPINLINLLIFIDKKIN